MTKSELIAEISAANPHLLSRDVETIVATIFNEISAALSRGDRVELRGFDAVPVDEKSVPFFKAGKELRERVNTGTPR